MFPCFILVLVVLIPRSIFAETTMETTHEDVSSSSNVKDSLGSIATESWDANNVNSLWSYRPTSHILTNADNAEGPHYMVFKQPHSLTRVAKTLSYGFDLHFLKGYLESFERRPKPVTLVGLRKNGIFPRLNVNMASHSFEVAELQSPYNDISHFWPEEPGSP